MQIYTSSEEFRSKSRYSIASGLQDAATIYRYYDNGTSQGAIWAQYVLSPFPSNCGTVIMSATQIYYINGKGLGEYIVREQIQLMKDLGYTEALCTTNSAQTIMARLLEKHGWKCIDKFRNKRSEKICKLWRYNLKGQDTNNLGD